MFSSRPELACCQVFRTSTRKPVFLLAADPLLLIGILFLWPLCLRNGLKSPADWPKSCLPPGGRADAMCLFYGTYVLFWTLIFFPPLPHFPHPRLHSGATRSPSRHGRWNSNGIAIPNASQEGWACGLSAALVRNAPMEGGTDTQEPQRRPSPWEGPSPHSRPAGKPSLATARDRGSGRVGGHHTCIGCLYIRGRARRRIKIRFWNIKIRDKKGNDKERKQRVETSTNLKPGTGTKTG